MEKKKFILIDNRTAFAIGWNNDFVKNYYGNKGMKESLKGFG
jgi:hypothetical protein